MLVLIGLYLFVVSRGFHLTYTSQGICMGSWVAVEYKGTKLPFTEHPPRLGAWPPLPRLFLKRKVKSKHINYHKI